MAKKFTMRQKTASGYETLYPKTVPEQVITDENNRFVSDEKIAEWNANERKINEAFNGYMTELDDIAMCSGIIVNAAAGWCSFSFPREFDGIPSVVIQPVNAEGLVMLNNVTPRGFQYQVRVPAPASYFTADAAAASSAHTARTVMTGFTTTADAVELSYIAVYDGDN